MAVLASRARGQRGSIKCTLDTETGPRTAEVLKTARYGLAETGEVSSEHIVIHIAQNVYHP